MLFKIYSLTAVAAAFVTAVFLWRLLRSCDDVSKSASLFVCTLLSLVCGALFPLEFLLIVLLIKGGSNEL